MLLHLKEQFDTKGQARRQIPRRVTDAVQKRRTLSMDLPPAQRPRRSTSNRKAAEQRERAAARMTFRQNVTRLTRLLRA